MDFIIFLIIMIIIMTCLVILALVSVFFGAVDSVLKLIPFLLKYLWPCFLGGIIGLLFKKKLKKETKDAFVSGMFGGLLLMLLFFAVFLNIPVTPRLVPEEEIAQFTITRNYYNEMVQEWRVAFSESSDEIKYIQNIYDDLSQKKYTHYISERVNPKDSGEYYTISLFDRDENLISTITLYDSRHLSVKNGIFTQYYHVSEEYDGYKNKRPSFDFGAVKQLYNDRVEAYRQSLRDKEYQQYKPYMDSLFESMVYEEGRIAFTIPDEKIELEFKLRPRLVSVQVDEDGVVDRELDNPEWTLDSFQKWEPGVTYYIDLNQPIYVECSMTFKGDYMEYTHDFFSLLPEEMQYME